MAATPDASAELTISTGELFVRLSSPRGDGASEAVGLQDTGAGEILAPAPLEDYSHAKVRYPSAAIDALASGQVLLTLHIDEHGSVTHVKPLRSAGYGFDELAAELVKSYRFRPARDGGGHAVASQIGWKISFAPWRPAPGGGSQPSLESGPTGVVVLAPEPKAGSPPAPTAPKALTRDEVEARRIAGLSNAERHELCRWQIRVRGGVHAEKCPAGVLQRDVFTTRPWYMGRQQDSLRGVGVPLVRRYDKVTIRVKPEAICVQETHEMDACSATVGAYVQCVKEIAQNPCDWKWIPTCRKLTEDCGILP